MKTKKSKTHTRKGRTFPTMSNAAGALGLDIYVLKDAKSHGCTAFRANGSVNEHELMKWVRARTRERIREFRIRQKIQAYLAQQRAEQEKEAAAESSE